MEATLILHLLMMQTAAKNNDVGTKSDKLKSKKKNMQDTSAWNYIGKNKQQTKTVMFTKKKM